MSGMGDAPTVKVRRSSAGPPPFWVNLPTLTARSLARVFRTLRDWGYLVGLAALVLALIGFTFKLKGALHVGVVVAIAANIEMLVGLPPESETKESTPDADAEAAAEEEEDDDDDDDDDSGGVGGPRRSAQPADFPLRDDAAQWPARALPLARPAERGAHGAHAAA